MVKSIIKRIIVGVSVAFIIMLLKGSLITSVSALDIASANIGGGGGIISSSSTQYMWYPNGSGYWSNWGIGHLRGVGSLVQIDHSSGVSPILFVRGVVASSGNQEFACTVGSFSNNNSTYTGVTFSYDCPMKMGSSGLSWIAFNFANGDASVEVRYRLQLQGTITFEQVADTEVNVDTSGIISQQQTTNNKLDETNDNLGDINDTLNDDSIDDDNVDDSLDDLQSQVSSNNVISSLLLLPITLYQNILNSLSSSGSSCPSFSLGSLLGHSLSMPCINLSALLGNDLYNIIDIMLSGFFILAIRKKLVDIFNHMTSLNDRGNEVE